MRDGGEERNEISKSNKKVVPKMKMKETGRSTVVAFTEI